MPPQAAAGAMYLVAHRELKTARFGAIYRFFPSLDMLDRVNHFASIAGFLGLTLGVALAGAYSVAYRTVVMPQIVWGMGAWVCISARARSHTPRTAGAARGAAVGDNVCQRRRPLHRVPRHGAEPRSVPVSMIPLAFHGEAVFALVVGCGRVGTRRAESRLKAGAHVRVISPEISAEIQERRGSDPRLIVQQREYAGGGDILDANLIVAATGSAMVNERVAADARLTGRAVNVERPGEGTFDFLAAHRCWTGYCRVRRRRAPHRDANSRRDCGAHRFALCRCGRRMRRAERQDARGSRLGSMA